MTTLCHLCGMPIPRWAAKQQNHPLSKTKDHIIPHSRYAELGLRGIEHNQFPAHRCCNLVRGDRAVTEKLRKRCERKARREFERAPWDVLAGLGQQRWSTV